MCDVSAHVDYEKSICYLNDYLAVKKERKVEEAVDFLIRMPRWKKKILLFFFPKMSDIADIFRIYFCWADISQRKKHLERIKRFEEKYELASKHHPEITRNFYEQNAQRAVDEMWSKEIQEEKMNEL